MSLKVMGSSRRAFVVFILMSKPAISAAHTTKKNAMHCTMIQGCSTPHLHLICTFVTPKPCIEPDHSCQIWRWQFVHHRCISRAVRRLTARARHNSALQFQLSGQLDVGCQSKTLQFALASLPHLATGVSLHHHHITWAIRVHGQLSQTQTTTPVHICQTACVLTTLTAILGVGAGEERRGGRVK